MWDILVALPYDNITPMSQTGSATIEKARLIASSYLDEHTVYAGAANNYFEAEEEDTIIVHRSDMILVRGVGTENVFDEICTIIERFRFWENELAMLVDHDRGLQKMLDCSKDILKAPCFVYAPDGHAYAISDDYPREIHWHWAEILDNGGITSDRMRTLRDSINLPDVWKDTFPKKRDSRMGSHQYMHCSLYPNGYMAGHLVLFGFSKPFDKGTERIVNVLAKYMTRHMEAFYSQYSPTSRLVEPFSALLSQGVFADEEISLSLRALRWSIDDTYRVYVFEERGEREPVLLSQLCSAISSQYPLAVPFALDEQLVVLENEQHVGAASILNNIEAVAGTDFACGISFAFEDLRRSRAYFQQARNELGHCKLAGTAFSRAEDHGMEQIMATLADSRLLATYAAHELASIKSHDEQHGTCYYPTLRAYVLSNFHLSDAARYLGIHRNSLLYRLGKMREITDLALVDEASATHDEAKLNYLLLSFAILDAPSQPESQAE